MKLANRAIMGYSFNNMGARKKIVSVVGALIEDDGRYLVCQRHADDTFGSRWEFPGGKVEQGEGKRQALVREIREELGVDIEVIALAGIYEDAMPHLTLRFFLYRCSIVRGVPESRECQDMRMATLPELRAMDLTPVDKKAVRCL